MTIVHNLRYIIGRGRFLTTCGRIIAARTKTDYHRVADTQAEITCYKCKKDRRKYAVSCLSTSQGSS